MEFDLSEDQRLFGESLRGFLQDRQPMETLRRMAEPGSGFDAGLWDGLTELGLHGLLVPEQFGGAGLGVLDAAAAAEALGGAAAVVPFAGSTVMATLALLRLGSPAQQAAYLPGIAAGEIRIGVGFAGRTGQTGPAEARLDGTRLSGRISGALDAGAPTHLLVCLPDGRAVLTGAAEAGVSVSNHRTIDRTRPVADLVVDGAAAEILGSSNRGPAALAPVLDAGRVVLAADTVGAAQTMLDRAVAYAKERAQFGRVIGSFQGVKHACADMATMLEPCRAMVWYAAHAQDSIPAEARLWACQVKAHVGDVGREVARISTEVHGGMGFTDLLGLHYWFKRIAFNRQALGGPERCRHDAAVEQGWIVA